MSLGAKLRAPCGECPFRLDGGRTLGRRHAEAILSYRGPFPCHKTVRYGGRSTRWRNHGAGQICAGRILAAAGTPDHPALAMAARHGLDPAALRGRDLVVETDAAFLARAS